MVICPNCGTRNENDAEVCVNCGVDLYSILRERRSEAVTGLIKRVKDLVTKPKANITIAISEDKNTLSLGEVLTGTLHVTSEEEFDADEIRVEVILERGGGRRLDGQEITDLSARRSTSVMDPLTRLYWIRERVSGPLHLTPGRRQNFYFTVKIPYEIEPTVLWFRTSRLRRRIRWVVRGVIAIKNRPNVTSKGRVFYTDLI